VVKLIEAVSFGESISYNTTFSGSSSPDTKKSPEAELQQRFFEDFREGPLETGSNYCRG